MSHLADPTTEAGAWLVLLSQNEHVSYATVVKRIAELVPKIEAEARQQDGSALRLLLDAIETMDQKITPYGEREDGTILHYIVADSTWHRILAAARSSEIYAALPPSAPPPHDFERCALPPPHEGPCIVGSVQSFR